MKSTTKGRVRALAGAALTSLLLLAPPHASAQSQILFPRKDVLVSKADSSSAQAKSPQTETYQPIILDSALVQKYKVAFLDEIAIIRQEHRQQLEKQMRTCRNAKERRKLENEARGMRFMPPTDPDITHQAQEFADSLAWARTSAISHEYRSRSDTSSRRVWLFLSDDKSSALPHSLFKRGFESLDVLSSEVPLTSSMFMERAAREMARDLFQSKAHRLHILLQYTHSNPQFFGLGLSATDVWNPNGRLFRLVVVLQTFEWERGSEASRPAPNKDKFVDKQGPAGQ